MWKIITLFLSLSGIQGHHVSHVTKVYHFVNEKMTWFEAQRYCREQFDDLAAINNPEELQRLQKSTHTIDDDFVWIGLHDDLTKWQWSDGEQDYIRGQHYGNWYPDRPNNKGGDQNCTIMYTNGQFNDFMCKSLFNAVCFDGEGNYIYVPDNMTWYKAREHCQSINAELASVRDATENQKIKSLLKYFAWIGLHRNPWSHWSDGSTSTFFNWKERQPNNVGGNQQCVGMTLSTAGYDDKNCEELHYVICQEWLNQRSTFRLKISSEADMTDPEVQQQFVEQLYTKLAKEGVTGVKLKNVLTDRQDQRSEK